jgi:DNA-binding FadR family transcriptional regulator
MEWMTQEPSTSTAFAEADLGLHVAIANASCNPFMRSIGGVIEAALRASFVLSAPVETADRDTVLSWHQRIIDAIAARDAEAASSAMLEVIHNGRRRHAQAVARTAGA